MSVFRSWDTVFSLLIIVFYIFFKLITEDLLLVSYIWLTISLIIIVRLWILTFIKYKKIKNIWDQAKVNFYSVTLSLIFLSAFYRVIEQATSYEFLLGLAVWILTFLFIFIASGSKFAR